MKYGKLTMGQVEAIVNKLGGMDGVKRLLSGELAISARCKFGVWKTIKLGGLETADDFRRALSDGFQFGEWVNDILGKPVFAAATEEAEVDLVWVAVFQLGFKEGALYDQIYKRAEELGLELCPPEVGLQLRLQYRNQPYGEWLPIGMKPIPCSDGSLGVFIVGCDGSGLRIDGHWHYPDAVCAPHSRLVFVRPRK